MKIKQTTIYFSFFFAFVAMSLVSALVFPSSNANAWCNFSSSPLTDTCHQDNKKSVIGLNIPDEYKDPKLYEQIVNACAETDDERGTCGDAYLYCLQKSSNIEDCKNADSYVRNISESCYSNKDSPNADCDPVADSNNAELKAREDAIKKQIIDDACNKNTPDLTKQVDNTTACQNVVNKAVDDCRAGLGLERDANGGWANDDAFGDNNGANGAYVEKFSLDDYDNCLKDKVRQNTDNSSVCSSLTDGSTGTGMTYVPNDIPDPNVPGGGNVVKKGCHTIGELQNPAACKLKPGTGWTKVPDASNPNRYECLPVTGTLSPKTCDKYTGDQKTACEAGQKGGAASCDIYDPSKPQTVSKAVRSKANFDACTAGSKDYVAPPPPDVIAGDTEEGAKNCGEANTVLISCNAANPDCTGNGDAKEIDKRTKGVPVFNCILRIGITVLTVMVGVAAVGGLAWASVIYAKAEDNSGQVGEARTLIRNVVIGLLLYGFLIAIINWLVPVGVIGT